MSGASPSDASGVDRQREIKSQLKHHVTCRDPHDHLHLDHHDHHEDHEHGTKAMARTHVDHPDHAEAVPFSEILQKAGARALGGGLPGAAAMGVQVLSLMWMRTTINYQYRHGTTTTQALRHLYKEGGVRRFYRGLGPALFQGPLSRFGDTAANAGMLSLLEQSPSTKDLPSIVKSASASVAAASFRILLMPIDTLKTTLQVEGAKGLPQLAAKLRANGPSTLYQGSLAASGATFAGHLPWFGTYNLLNDNLPPADPDSEFQKLARNGGMGFFSSMVSDTVSNSIRVTKTTKQTAAEYLTYPQAVRLVIQEDGIVGLFGRGLRTRILANGMQGMLFGVLWKFFEAQFFPKD